MMLKLCFTMEAKMYLRLCGTNFWGWVQPICNINSTCECLHYRRRYAL